MQVQSVTSLAAVAAADWDALVGTDNPFVEHAFLLGLERSGSVGPPDSGWLPRHLLVHDGDQLVAAMPLYEKHHPYGEYIFDWAWADAAERAGLDYYPKLVAAVPFTPATGPRLLRHPEAPQPEALTGALLAGAQQLLQALSASSLHVLFCQPEEVAELAAAGMMPRLSHQFHWHRDPSWHTFDDYLAALRAPARKQVRRERATAAAHGLQICMRSGPELKDADWAALYQFYLNTVANKQAMAYLPAAFFAELRGSLAPRVLAAMAYAGDVPVAGALYLRKGAHLYGRYWGAHQHYDALHFELCYYQPIAWALAHGVQQFEAGAQGEHKLKRGLLPAACHSAHWLQHPGLNRAVRQYVEAERSAHASEMAALAAHTPFSRAG